MVVIRERWNTSKANQSRAGDCAARNSFMDMTRNVAITVGRPSIMDAGWQSSRIPGILFRAAFNFLLCNKGGTVPVIMMALFNHYFIQNSIYINGK